MAAITDCEHLVQYYETDQMGVTHHSNYIRWFEEARTKLFEEIGLGYKGREEMGIMSPVVGLTAKYTRRDHEVYRSKIRYQIYGFRQGYRAGKVHRNQRTLLYQPYGESNLPAEGKSCGAQQI